MVSLTSEAFTVVEELPSAYLSPTSGGSKGKIVSQVWLGFASNTKVADALCNGECFSAS